jgi:hypothetical protein
VKLRHRWAAPHPTDWPPAQRGAYGGASEDADDGESLAMLGRRASPSAQPRWERRPVSPSARPCWEPQALEPPSAGSALGLAPPPLRLTPWQSTGKFCDHPGFFGFGQNYVHVHVVRSVSSEGLEGHFGNNCLVP